MAVQKKWKDLSRLSRRLLVLAALAEGGLKVAALLDLRRRPASEIRGPKWAWSVGLTIANSFGVVPLSYFAFGRRR